jgi:hypothetical protein
MCGGELVYVDKAIPLYGGVDCPHTPVVEVEWGGCPHPPVAVVESHSCLVYYLRVAVSLSLSMRQYFCTVGWTVPTHQLW